MPNLDSGLTNELGKGILPPALEAELLADGYIYARRLVTPRGQSVLFCGKRPLADFARDLVLDAQKTRKCLTLEPTAAG